MKPTKYLFYAVFSLVLSLINYSVMGIVKLPANINLYAQSKSRLADLSDGSAHIYFCGTGNPQTSMQNIRKPSCLAVAVNKELWVFDAGEGAIQTMAGMGLPIANITKIFVTHLHSDHIAGLGQILNQTWIQGRKKPIEIYGPNGIEQIIQGLKLSYGPDIIIRAKVELLNPELALGTPHILSVSNNQPKTVFDQDSVKLQVFKVDHNPATPAFGYILYLYGTKVVISGDTTMTESLAENSKDADILINEVYSNPLYYNQQLKNARTLKDVSHLHNLRAYHTDSYELAKMAELAQVKNLVLTHLDPAIPNDSEAKKEFVAGMNNYYTGPLIVADDKDEIIISPREKLGKDENSITYRPADSKNFFRQV